MLRSSFMVFICGWAVWFALDKPGAIRSGFHAGSGGLLDNFQLAFDMLKAGYADMAFIYIWKQHYLVLSVLGGVLFAMVIGALRDHTGRRRMRRLLVPGNTGRNAAADVADHPGPTTAPDDDHELVGDKRVK